MVYRISLSNAVYSGHVLKCIFREYRNIQGALHLAVTSYTPVRYFNVEFQFLMLSTFLLEQSLQSLVLLFQKKKQKNIGYCPANFSSNNVGGIPNV
jgi:hypothetical protein